MSSKSIGRTDQSNFAAEEVAIKPSRYNGPVLSPARFKEACYARNDYVATVEDGITLEQMLVPGFWRSLGRQINIGDKIEVRNDALTLFAILVCVAADHISSHIEVRELISKTSMPAIVENQVRGDYAVSYTGLTDQWTIRRVLDGHIMKKNLPSRDAANNEILVGLVPKLSG